MFTINRNVCLGHGPLVSEVDVPCALINLSLILDLLAYTIAKSFYSKYAAHL
jgi:hypothetical protein